MTETLAVHDHAQKASCVMSENSSMTETPVVHDLYTQEASCVMSENGSMTETPAVHDLYA